ncbi:MAG: HDOD domain-containing protein [Terriglobales bacterium]
MKPSLTATMTATIRQRVQRIQTMPAIPAVFLPLLKLLARDEVEVEEVVRLVSYDSAISAQCLRVASSPLFAMAQPPKSIKGAVMSLGLRRVETIILTCCLGQAFPSKKWALDPIVFWRHSLGCAMVCRKISEKLARADREKAYTAGLMHDIGFMVNCLVFAKEFAPVMATACQEGSAIDEVEQATLGFTHCDTGRALAEKWALADDIVEVISHHHAIENSQKAQPLVALVHLSDLLCRMRGMGYGYYERHKVDLTADPAWEVLHQEYRDLEGVDLVQFTFDLDEAVEEIHTLVSMVFGPAPAHT